MIEIREPTKFIVKNFLIYRLPEVQWVLEFKIRQEF